MVVVIKSSSSPPFTIIHFKILLWLFKILIMILYGVIIPIVLIHVYCVNKLSSDSSNFIDPLNKTFLNTNDDTKWYSEENIFLYPPYSHGYNKSLTLYNYLIFSGNKCTLGYDDLQESDHNVNVILENVMFLVLSAPNNYQKRQSIRRTWGFKQRVYFFTSFVNLSYENTLKIHQESNDYHDIVFLNMYDTYDNLTLKVYSSIQWISKYCKDRNALIIKVNDNVFFNINLQFVLNEYFLINNKYIYGRLFSKAKPKKTGKYSINEHEYPFYYYPPFVSGSCYIMKKNDFINLINYSTQLKYFKLENVFFTGIAAKIFNYKHLHIPNILSLYNNITSSTEMKSILSVHSISIKEMYELYKLM
ncbi:MAG: N-acetyllactosaminide beta-1,3-N-acetylglucosaminyltransferase [Cotesia congregata filamentous virus 2]